MFDMRGESANRVTPEITRRRPRAASGEDEHATAIEHIFNDLAEQFGAPALPANMGETVTRWKFRVEGESGLESDECIGAGPGWAGDRGGGEGDAAAVLGGLQVKDRPGGRRL
jgi:hypothetical protein